MTFIYIMNLIYQGPLYDLRVASPALLGINDHQRSKAPVHVLCFQSASSYNSESPASKGRKAILAR